MNRKLAAAMPEHIFHSFWSLICHCWIIKGDSGKKICCAATLSLWIPADCQIASFLINNIFDPPKMVHLPKNDERTRTMQIPRACSIARECGWFFLDLMQFSFCLIICAPFLPGLVFSQYVCMHTPHRP
jgi:hypothetical protein